MKEIVTEFLTFKNTLKLYHWRTPVYSKHKVSDQIHQNMDELIDKFVEVLIGSRDEKPNGTYSIKLTYVDDKTIVKYLENFREWLTEKLPKYIQNYETDLMNLRDELLAETNRGLYLIRMK